jgi:hypothetical protein
VELGRIGIWTSAFERQLGATARQVDAEIDGLGHGTLWAGEADRTEP